MPTQQTYDRSLGDENEIPSRCKLDESYNATASMVNSAPPWHDSDDRDVLEL
jgi:hypothetical protein